MPQTIRSILDAIQKCRSGEITPGVIKTLGESERLRAVFHGHPQYLDCLFLNFEAKHSTDAVELFSNLLPAHASFRVVAGTLGIDAIITGESTHEWFDELLKDNTYAKRLGDYCSLILKPIKRYRWRPVNHQIPVLDPELNPSIDDALLFLKADKEKTLTRLVYDPTKVSALSVFALIESDLLEHQFVERLEDHLQPVRDLYKKVNYDTGLGNGELGGAISSRGYVAVCEFDGITNGSFELKPGMNEAYKWRLQVLDQPGIDKVSLIPCMVVKDSYDILDPWAVLKGFTPSTKLTIASPNDRTKTKDISYPVWTSIICGGPRSGKSMTAYYIMASLLKGDPAHDVIFVNFKASDRDNEGTGPARIEGLEFARMINECAKKPVRLVSPSNLEQTLIASNGAQAYYTEAHKDVGAEHFLQAIVRALDDRKSPRHCYVVFDEVLNQEKASTYMSEILIAHNKYPSLNFFTGVIGHQLEQFWMSDDARRYAMESTTVVAGPIGDKDVDRFEALRQRAKRESYLNRTISAEELKTQGKGKFVFLPYTSTKQEYPMFVNLPALKTPLREKPPNIPDTWKWGMDVAD